MNEPSDTPIRVVITGTQGRMSKRLRAFADNDLRFKLIAEFGARTGENTESNDVEANCSFDVVIDFTNEDGTKHALRLAREAACALVVGTTSLSRGILDDTVDLARSHPVMIAPNTSIGAAILNQVVEAIARQVASRFDIDIVERHHIHKRDAPSGTARQLAQSIERATGVPLPSDRVHSIRAGDIIGEHEVTFSSPGEILFFSHRVTNRDLFALGALDLAAWLTRRKPGLYSIQDYVEADASHDETHD
ncbi:MAG: 4-hydroxy-tetrahydrodipicolinate reductase [Planctomycetota bacterium]|nr:4-hydroxy-tetrahydrodipicolinate reductase [Planctomycetota bacterium]